MAAAAGVFFGLWLQRPLQIAAVFPSSTHLADAMAGLADWQQRPGTVLDLGAGTGSLTRGLIRGGCPPSRILAIERETRLVSLLQRDIPGIEAVEADATRIAEVLDARGIDRLAAVISGLPVKWFSVEAQRAVVMPCLERLGPGGRFVQLTNAFCSPLATEPLGIAGHEARRIWRNLPPAQIWSYSARGDAGREARP